MNTIPRHLSIVPACPYTFAISLAVAEVEKRLQGRAARGAHPYAITAGHAPLRLISCAGSCLNTHPVIALRRLRGNTWLRSIRLLPHAASAALRRCRRIPAQGCFR